MLAAAGRGAGGAHGPLQTSLQLFLTLQRVLDEPQLADDVAGNVGFYSLADFGVSLCGFQEVIELLGVKLLDGEKSQCGQGVRLCQV